MKSLKQVICILTTIAKAKSMAVKSKTSAIKTRLTLFKLLHDKKMLMGVISKKVHADKAEAEVQDYSKAVVSYKPTSTKLIQSLEEGEEEEEYPHITNSILDLDLEEEDNDEFEECSGSITDLISAQGDSSGLFPENEIDKAADVFIRSFRMQMQLQKQESFKRYQDMLERGA